MPGEPAGVAGLPAAPPVAGPPAGPAGPPGPPVAGLVVVPVAGPVEAFAVVEVELAPGHHRAVGTYNVQQIRPMLFPKRMANVHTQRAEPSTSCSAPFCLRGPCVRVGGGRPVGFNTAV